MKLIWCKHVNFYQTNNAYIIFNSVNKATYKVSKELKSQIDKYIDGEECTNEVKKLISELYYEKIIVKDTFEHADYVKSTFELNKKLAPLTIYFIATYNCNFMCPYCIVNSTDHKCESGVIAEENIEGFALQIYQYARSNGSKEINMIIFGGEPTLALRENILLIEHLNSVLKGNIPITYTMVTNAFLLTEKNILRIKNAGVKSLQITLDGPKEIHDKTRIHIGNISTFDKLIENIELCKKHSVPVMVRINFCQTNVRHIIELIEFLSKRKLQDAIGIMLAPVDPNLGSDISGHNPESLMHVEDIYERIFKNGFHAKEWATYCGIGNNNFFALDLKGDIYGCPSFAGMEQYRFGNIFRNGIEEDKRYVKKIMHNCLECAVVGLCAGGCAFTRMTKFMDEDICFKDVHLEMSRAFNIAKYAQKQLVLQKP